MAVDPAAAPAYVPIPGAGSLPLFAAGPLPE
jgi:hypothetical protein